MNTANTNRSTAHSKAGTEYFSNISQPQTSNKLDGKPTCLSRKLTTAFSLSCFLLFLSSITFAQKLQLNNLEYFETPGINVFVFSNQFNGLFFDEKTAGIEIIHHGVRTFTGGAVRLQNTPEQWDLVPFMANRKVDQASKTIQVEMLYKELNFSSKVSVTPRGNGIEINVYLDKPLPQQLEGNAGFNLEFIPSALLFP